MFSSLVYDGPGIWGSLDMKRPRSAGSRVSLRSESTTQRKLLPSSLSQAVCQNQQGALLQLLHMWEGLLGSWECAHTQLLIPSIPHWLLTLKGTLVSGESLRQSVPLANLRVICCCYTCKCIDEEVHNKCNHFFLSSFKFLFLSSLSFLFRFNGVMTYGTGINHTFSSLLFLCLS